jgi:CubicO group peptidase (beta-lactamase class C family)
LPVQPAGVTWPTQTWPTGAAAPRTDREVLAAALDQAFRGSEPLLGETRAVVIVEGGRIVSERYAEGFGAETRLVSWSMAKSITHALVGIAVGEGRVDIDKPMGNPHWGAGDERSAVTWRQWLNMVDGQQYLELGAPSATASDIARMLFGPGRLDAAAYAASLPLAHRPGSLWNYNSAGEILVCDALTRAIVPAPASPEARRAAMLAWMRAALFDRIGMQSAQPEFDAAGLFLGSSLVYATARDFAKLGLLYLRDGVWDGRRVLPAGWVDFARTPSLAANGDVYGAGWWVDPAEGTGRAMYSYVDTGPTREAFDAQGHEGQMILLVPSKDLIIVRLGHFDDRADNWKALEDWMGRVARAFPAG